MWKTGLIVVIGALLLSCTSGLAPNGMSWEEYRAAEYRLKVTHNAADVVDCQELGVVRGSDDHDMGLAKDDAIKKALMLKGDTIYFESLWSEWLPGRLVGRAEIFYADGRVYRCVD